MPGCGVGADTLPDVPFKARVQFHPRAQHDEQHHAHVVLPALRDRDAVQHRAQALDLAIDFRRADAHAARVEHRIGAPVDDKSAVGGDLCVVSVRPDPSGVVEVRRAKARAVRVVPEAQGAGGKRARTHQLAFLTHERAAVVAADFHGHAQPRGLNLTAVHGQHRGAAHKAGQNIGAAGDTGQADIGFNVAVDVVKTLVGQRRAGREHTAQTAQVMAVHRLLAGFFQGGDKLRAGAEDADPVFVDDIQQALAVAGKRRALVKHQGGAASQTRHQPVPHHPAAGGEVEKNIVGAQPDLQAVLFQMLQQGAASAVHNGLGHARGARGIQDAQRVIERQRLEAQRRGVGAQQVLKAARAGHAAQVRRGAQQRRHPHRLNAVDGRGNARHALKAVTAFTVIDIAIGGEQHPGGNLAEAIEHARNTEIQRAGRPHRAETGRRQHRDHRLGHIGHQSRHPIAGAHTQSAQFGGHTGHRVVQFIAGDAPRRALFEQAEQRRARAAAAQQIPRVVEFNAGKPARARKALAVFEHGPRRRVDQRRAKVPERAPESRGAAHRPGVQAGVT